MHDAHHQHLEFVLAFHEPSDMRSQPNGFMIREHSKPPFQHDAMSGSAPVDVHLAMPGIRDRVASLSQIASTARRMRFGAS
jgi:hypothetical protein